MEKMIETYQIQNININKNNVTLSIQVVGMPIAPLLKEEADELYQMKKKVVHHTGWIPSGSFAQKMFFDIETEDETRLEIRVWKSTIGKERYSFSLLYKNGTPVRRWDDKKNHECPISHLKTTGPHKHYWHHDFRDAPCYETKDVRVGDSLNAIYDFLKECNVELDGLAIQDELEN